jgi:hypothetical protein
VWPVQEMGGPAWKRAFEEHTSTDHNGRRLTC